MLFLKKLNAINSDEHIKSTAEHNPNIPSTKEQNVYYFDTTLRHIPKGICHAVFFEKLPLSEIEIYLNNKELAENPDGTQEISPEKELSKFQTFYEKLQSTPLNLMADPQMQEFVNFFIEVDLKNSFEKMLQGNNKQTNELGLTEKGKPLTFNQAILVFFKYIENKKNDTNEFIARTMDIISDAFEIMVSEYIEHDTYNISSNELRNAILFGSEVSPRFINECSEKGAVGFINALYGEASHSGIEANKLEKFYLKNAELTSLLKNGDRLLFLGKKIIINPTAADISFYHRKIQKNNIDEIIPDMTVEELLKTPALTEDLQTINLFGKIGDANYNEELFKNYPIGLFYTEKNYQLNKDYAELYLKIFNNHNDNSIALRLVDVSLDKLGDMDIKIRKELEQEITQEPEKQKTNHGLKFLLYTAIGQKIFQKQLAEIKKALAETTNKNIFITFPMVESKEDYLEAKKRAIALGIPAEIIGLTIEDKAMCNINILEEIAPAYIQIGGSDLLCSFTGKKRDDLNLLFDGIKTPGFLDACKNIADLAQKLYKDKTNRRFCFCGEAASYAPFYKILLGFGIHNMALALTPEKIGTTILHTRSIYYDDCKELTDSFLNNVGSISKNILNAYDSQTNTHIRSHEKQFYAIVQNNYEYENEQILKKIHDKIKPGIDTLRKNMIKEYQKEKTANSVWQNMKNINSIGNLIKNDLWGYSEFKPYLIKHNDSAITQIDGFKETLNETSREEIVRIADIFLKTQRQEELFYLSKKTLNQPEIIENEKLRQIAIFSQDKQPIVLAIKNVYSFFEFIANKNITAEMFYQNYLQALKKKYSDQIDSNYFNSVLFIRLPAMDTPDSFVLYGFSNRKRSIQLKQEKNVWPKGLYKERLRRHSTFFKDITITVNDMIKDINEFIKLLEEIR